MIDTNELIVNLVGGLLVEIFAVLVGIFFAYVIKAIYDRWRHGGWRVRVMQNGEEVMNRPISPRKSKEIKEEAADLSVFLKGVASPYEWIKCDIISKGRELGLLIIDEPQKSYIIDLDKNPAEETKAATADDTG